MTVERLAARVERLERAEKRNAVIRALVWALCVLVLAVEVLWICAAMSAHGVRPFTLPPPTRSTSDEHAGAAVALSPAVAVRALLCHHPLT